MTEQPTTPEPVPASNAVPAFLDPRRRAEEQRPPRLSRRRRRQVALAAALVVLCLASVGTVTYVVPFLEQYSATVSAPDQIAGMPRVGLSSTNSIAWAVRAVSSVAAVYAATGEPRHMVTVNAAAGLSLHPPTTLDWIFYGRNQPPLHRPGVQADNITEVDPGPMGGVARCGTDTSEPTTGVCVWADYGSVGAVTAEAHTPAQTADLMRVVRAAVLHR